MWTIAQAALNEKDPLRMGVLMMFWLESNIMASIPFFTVNRLGISMTRQVRTSLTKPGWVAIGEAYGKSHRPPGAGRGDRLQARPGHRYPQGPGEPRRSVRRPSCPDDRDRVEDAYV